VLLNNIFCGRALDKVQGGRVSYQT